MKFYLILLGGILSLFACSIPEEKNLASLVNPFIGTGGHGHTYPGVSAPFGFVQLSPDSRLDGWDGCGGYHYSDSVIYGFSHTHLSGTGVSDYGDILIMPTPSNTFKNAYGIHPDSGYGSVFSHDNESAEAGYYKVFLKEGQIDVELTSSKRAAFHQYTYQESASNKNLVIDLQHRDELLEWSISIIDDTTIVGKRISKAWAQEQHIYFHLKLNETIRSYAFNSDSSKLILSFDQINQLKIKLGLSAVDEAGAKNNLEVEIPHWSFERTLEENQKAWNKELGKIEVKMAHDSDLTIFYTALYHSYLCPTIFQDQDGRYRSTDLKVYSSTSHEQYSIFSLWDTFRATHPLFTITQRKRTLQFIKTFLDHYQKGGKLPVWELAGNYTGCMIGYHSIPVIVDAYFKGIANFDTELALEAMLATARSHELGKEHFRSKGYMAADEEHESVSKNLEYAYDDWCIAIYAKALGKDDIYEEFIESAQYYKNIFDPETDFFRAKRNQQFTEPFDPREVNFNYTEANSWQYSAFVPQDINGLIKLHGGEIEFEEHLDSLFHSSPITSGRTQVDITGLIGQYAHGNEPSHHMAYLYNFLAKEHKTQELVRKVLEEMYTNQPDGLIGNEDCGQMSSWYVFSALGFYPVSPGSDQYIIGSPMIKEANIHLENGKDFRISVENNSLENIYLQEAYLNAERLDRSFILQEEILAGGELKFVMGKSANMNCFGIHPSQSIQEKLITAVPYIQSAAQVFQDSTIISIHHIDSAASIQYALDDSLYMDYKKPFYIHENRTIKIKAVYKDRKESKIGEAQFFKRDKHLSVTYKYLYHPQYSAGGKDALVDQIRGGNDFRTGLWQGFQGEDLELIIELKEAKNISKVKAGFLQDINSWIWMPKEIEVYFSEDGENYYFVATKGHSIPTDEYGVFLKDLSISVYPKKCKSIKLIAKQFGTLPDWHLGAGGESFIFIDEVIVQ